MLKEKKAICAKQRQFCCFSVCKYRKIDMPDLLLKIK